MNNVMERYELERQENWEAHARNMPFFKFPPGWEVQINPPTGGALARFRVKLPSGEIKSIYFDAHNRLGYFGEPYWEVYPYQGDVGRCAQDESERLIEMIAD